MSSRFTAFLCGALFALGLGYSGMTQPGKVTAFLDFAGRWDPSLLFVMAGAIFVYSIGYRLTVRRPKPVLADSFHLPTLRKVDRPLAVGSALFGIGWGLAGFCPGPAVTSLVALRPETLIFVTALVAGIFAYDTQARRKR